MTQIFYTNHFVRALKKLPPELKTIVRERESIFKRNMFDQRLRTHSLRGELSGYYAFSLTYKYRVIFELDANDNAIFINIGDHGIYG